MTWKPRVFRVWPCSQKMPDLVKADGKRAFYSPDDYDYEPVSRDEIIKRAI